MNFRRLYLISFQKYQNFSYNITLYRNYSYTSAIGINIASITKDISTTSTQSNISDINTHNNNNNNSEKTLKRIRGRVENARVRGKLAFIHLRQPPFHSIQVVVSGVDMSRQVKSLTPETIIDVIGNIIPAASPITSVSCTNYEIHAKEINIISKAETPLPFPIRDLKTKLDTRLNHRCIDMRTSLTATILRIVSIICQNFRKELLSCDFVEIHTPKLIKAASEGGSAVFAVDYFGQSCFLAQSPQLYKQMSIMGDMMRVFEIAPVYRAEKSLTHRHLTEFIGLDAEFVINNSYIEILDILEVTFCKIIYSIQGEYGELLQQVQTALNEIDATEGNIINKEKQKERSDIVCEVSEATIASFQLISDNKKGGDEVISNDIYNGRIGGGNPKVLRLAFEDAVRLLQDNNNNNNNNNNIIENKDKLTDFTLPQERKLGELIKERYGVDVYIIDQFPASSRPFYTMPHSKKLNYTCSFDMYLRGEEICSGAQRIHNYQLLLENMQQFQLNIDSLKDYLDAFKYGAWPHGGFGLGLERIALFLLGVKDIRQVSLFPRDPKRLTP